jgi:cytoskeleton-associated protein 5
MFAHTDKSVRQEAVQLSQQLYKNIGSAIMPFLNDLKPVQVKELNDIFQQLDNDGVGQGTFVPLRMTRIQQEQGEVHDDQHVDEIKEGASLLL